MEKRDQLHKRISELLLILEANNNRIYLHSERLPQLEIDLLRKHAIELYDCINRLALSGEAKGLETLDKLQSVVLDRNPDIEVAQESDLKPAEELKPAKSIKAEAPKTKTKKLAKEKKQTKKKSAKEKEEPTSVYERYKMKSDEKSVIERFKSKPISDLTKAISISQRFEFQQNLFQGDKARYSTFIKAINDGKEFDKALNLFVSMEKEYNWENGKLKNALRELIYRRYDQAL